MTRGRLEAFSDGVIAIVITIMVLELEVPHGTALADLRPLLPRFLTYALSFGYLGIYWNNHHHMLHAAEKISGLVLWANLGLLFCLSLVPFVTGWMGENHVAPVPVAAYGVVMLLAAVAWQLLQGALVRANGPGSRLADAVGCDWKGKASLLAYAASVPLALTLPWASMVVFVGVALAWLVPDRRFEAALRREG